MSTSKLEARSLGKSDSLEPLGLEVTDLRWSLVKGGDQTPRCECEDGSASILFNRNT